MEETIFTVVIPTYNRSNMIHRAIESVIAQTEQNWKMLIIDDASTDDTASRVTQLTENVPRVTYIKLEENIGISHIMNKALTMIDTPYFIQLDSDDWIEKNTLEEFKKAIMTESKNTALFYANTKISKRIDKQWKVIKKVQHRQFSSKYDFLRYLTYIINPRCFRTEAVLSVGGWDTSDKYDGRIMEDRRICLKLMEKYPYYWIDDYLYNRTKHQSQLSNTEYIKKRNYLRKEFIEYYLDKWGNKYYPVYYHDRKGYLKIRKFIKKK